MRPIKSIAILPERWSSRTSNSPIYPIIKLIQETKKEKVSRCIIDEIVLRTIGMKHQESEKSQNMSKMDTVESDESLLTYHSSALLART